MNYYRSIGGATGQGSASNGVGPISSNPAEKEKPKDKPQSTMQLINPQSQLATLQQLPRPLRYKTCYRNTVWDVFKGRGWKETLGYIIYFCSFKRDDFDLIWADKEWIRDELDKMHLSEGQKVNHFRNHYEVFLNFPKLTS